MKLRVKADQLSPGAVYRSAGGGIAKLVITGQRGAYLTLTRVADKHKLQFVDNYLLKNFEYIGHMPKFVRTKFAYRTNPSLTVTVTKVQGTMITYQHDVSKTIATISASNFKKRFDV